MDAALGSSLRILLVEDTPNDERLIRRLFERTDSPLVPGSVEFQHVETIDEAVEAVATEQPDLLLLDLGLPESSGKETYDRARERLPSVPIVVLTGLKDEETAVELLQAGAQDYLNKDSLSEGALMKSVRYALERQKHQRELKRTTRAIDKAPIGVTISDPTTEDNPIIYVNERFEEMTGYSAEDALGRNCRFLQGEQTEAEPVAEMHEAIEQQRPVTVELRNYRKDGTQFWNRVSIAPVRDENDELLNYVGFQQDVTEQKERQQELEQQNERLSEFASVVSHDLRNPLSVALGHTTVLEQMCDEEALDQVNTIVDSLDRMERIIEDTLTLAREGDTVGEKHPIRISELVGNCWEQVETADATVNIDEAFTILGDETRLKHVFENLFGNAVTHGGEDVVVRVGRTGGDAFYVEDSGAGIPPEDRETVFEAGYSSERNGTGFGLTIVKRIAEAHGWNVTVTAGRDGGARFEFDTVEFVSAE